jgi:predicted transcriptional regulator
VAGIEENVGSDSMIRFERTAQILTAVKNNPDQIIVKTARTLHADPSNLGHNMKALTNWQLIQVSEGRFRITRKGMEWLTTWNTLKELMKE